MLGLLLQLVSGFAIIEFILINAAAELVKYLSLKLFVKLDSEIKNRMEQAEKNLAELDGLPEEEDEN